KLKCGLSSHLVRTRQQGPVPVPPSRPSGQAVRVTLVDRRRFGGQMGVQSSRSHRSTRREFLLLSGAALTMAQPAFAGGQKPKIGYLSWFPKSIKGDLDRFREGMEKVGYTESDYEIEGH